MIMADTESSQIQDALEHSIANRPSADQLERRDILKPGGNHADARAVLDRNLTRIVVNRQFNQRPDYSDLVQSNIAYDSGLAPSLQASARALERRMRSDKLNAALQQRSRPDQVQQYMPSDGVAPRLRSTQIALDQAITRDRLKHKLNARPHVQHLLDNNILKAAPSVAPSLQGTQAELEKQMLADRLNEFIGARIANHADRGPTRIRPKDKYDSEQTGDGNNCDNCSEQCCYTSSAAQHDVGVGDGPYELRARSFVLTRILLKFVANLSDAGEITPAQKGLLKDLVIDQDPSILAAADVFESDGDVEELKDTIIRLIFRR